MSAQVKIFSPTSPHSLLRVSYDNTVDDALADIWNDSETDFLRRKIAFNQLSLRSLVRDRLMRNVYPSLRQSTYSVLRFQVNHGTLFVIGWTRHTIPGLSLQTPQTESLSMQPPVVQPSNSCYISLSHVGPQ